MNMDEGRDRHPWMILANECPIDYEEFDVDGESFAFPETQPRRDDPFVQGDFWGGLGGGNKNRTAICKIVPWNRDTAESISVLFQLGETKPIFVDALTYFLSKLLFTVNVKDGGSAITSSSSGLSGKGAYMHMRLLDASNATSV